MKKTERIRKEAERTMEKIRGITRHMRNVENNCLILGEKLIMRGEIELGHDLIANGFVHDASKFHGIEWDNMAPGTTTGEESAKLKMKMAVNHHRKINPHHPEYWGEIQKMPRVYIAEMVCDWKARSEEFGSSLKDYIDELATKRWGFVKDDKTYKEIISFVDLLCEKPFEQIAHS
jgi:hypothetical protein